MRRPFPWSTNCLLIDWVSRTLSTRATLIPASLFQDGHRLNRQALQKQCWRIEGPVSRPLYPQACCTKGFSRPREGGHLHLGLVLSVFGCQGSGVWRRGEGFCWRFAICVLNKGSRLCPADSFFRPWIGRGRSGSLWLNPELGLASLFVGLLATL